MRKSFFSQALLLLIGACCFLSQQTNAQAAAQDKAAVKRMVEEVLEENPQLLMDALDNLRKKMEAEKEFGGRDILSKLRHELERDPRTYIAGNPQGDVTIIAFFDYRCGFCKRSHPIMQELLIKDPNIRLALKEFPILGPDSLVASRAAIAAMTQQKYLPFHDALMLSQGTLSPERVLRIARDSGLDIAELRKDMDDPAIEQTIKRNHEIAQSLAISGTPSYIIGDTLVPGYVDLQELQKLVAAARRKCETCN